MMFKQMFRGMILAGVAAMVCMGVMVETLFAAEEVSVIPQYVVLKTNIQTNNGIIKIKLNPEKAPVSVENFLSYVNEGFYNQTIFHRVIPNFMIQGGGFTTDFEQKKTHAPIKNEAANGLKNNRGTIAMARTSDPNSATAQFFINLKDNDFLNFTAPTNQGYGYAVFGEVVDGMDVVDAIAQIKTGNKNGYSDVPMGNVIIESAMLECVAGNTSSECAKQASAE